MTGTHSRWPGARLTASVGLALGAGLLTGLALTRPRLRRLQNDNRRHQRDLRHWEWRAHHDPLTGLLNRAGLNRHLDEHDGQLGTVVLIDLDEFKPLNDTHGHRAGDALLTVLGQRLARAATSTRGLAARLGGDEFLLALPPATPASDVEAILDTLTTATGLMVGELIVDIRPALSAGLARRNGHSWTDTLHHADLALYAAKREPHRRLALYTPHMRRAGASQPPRRLRDARRP
ncbi:diguanylate cyclase domain-containing protein [Cryptosporangium sp. NPDC048952]|uniref:diguanylate cyclase domain-containing protein n=1 Tax=Cryptosporangium sp. NPDC048952 TaxID=3363961 RepID=UPI0037206DF5